MSGPPPARDPICERGLWLALGLALLVRLYFLTVKGGMYHPDEIFQYLEPAHRHRGGYARLFWEHERGARNWVLSGFYGAWMEVGALFGLAGDGMLRFLRLHSALLSLGLVPAAYALGALAHGRRAALVAAWATAAHPWLAYLSVHTLSEIPGAVAIAWAYVCWLWLARGPEPRRALRVSAWGGALLALAFALRYSLVLWALAPAIDLLWRRRWSQLAGAAAGMGCVLIPLALLDWASWGTPLHSVIEYARFHLVEGAGRWHGVSPPGFYFEHALWGVLGFGLPVLLWWVVPTGARQPRLTAGWLLPLLLLSLMQLKQERFVYPIWPFLLTAGAIGAVELVARMRDAGRTPATVVLSATLAGALLLSTAWARTLALPMRAGAGIFDAEREAARRADLTGLLVDGRPWLDGPHGRWLDGDYEPFYTGGSMHLGRNVPSADFDAQLIEHRLFNYAALGLPEHRAQIEQSGRFEPIARFAQDVTLYRRVR